MKKRGMTTDEVISNYPESVKILLRDLLLKIDAQIQQKPTVTRKWAKECWGEIMEYHIDKGFSGESIFIQRLKEAGVEVVD